MGIFGRTEHKYPLVLLEATQEWWWKTFLLTKTIKKNGLHLGGEGLAYGFHEGLGDQDGVEGGCVCIYIYVSIRQLQ